MPDFSGKKVLVLGLGESGKASAALLRAAGAIARVSESSAGPGMELKKKELQDLGIDIEIGANTSAFCAGAELVVTSPGVDIKALRERGVIERDVPVIGELELGYLFCKAPIVAVTGTNGKSTTCRLIGNMLTEAGVHNIVCGNIGNPLSGEVDKLGDKSVAVVEVSSYQLETIKDFQPYIALLLNITEDHYDRHVNMEQYRVAKFRIFMNQSGADWAIMNGSMREDPLLSGVKAKVRFFGREGDGVAIHGRDVHILTKGLADAVIKGEDMPMSGEHNLENVASSAMVCQILGVDSGAIIKGVKSFHPLEHRFQTVATYGGVDFIDDSKATNIDATARALGSLDKKVVLIAGGRDKGGDYAAIKGLVGDKVSAFVLIGEAAQRISGTFEKTVPCYFARDMADAVSRSATLARPGEVVMLSPMCSSFDMYKNYKERGLDFRKAVDTVTRIPVTKGGV
ncbi:MAG: UDP-N-acetylmuramoyl-L-alanine--D-glutamate ligase [Candidatus Omnitrophica bacterium]|nr:UDP-N-acetylmuramoyl-L-alanine--D-glutamate ligase [Candidatus Omnitrophota bacterium]MDD5488021.1 UDP-N-acetylmuramoyl-L-alanine--D-glutamate ligase [Candidatus Omnitrophota bacterium]